MTCYKTSTGIVCTSSGIYHYKGVTFDWHNYLGPIVLRHASLKERSWRNVSNRQWRLIGKWHKLPKTEQVKYKIN